MQFNAALLQHLEALVVGYAAILGCIRLWLAQVVFCVLASELRGSIIAQESPRWPPLHLPVARSYGRSLRGIAF